MENKLLLAVIHDLRPYLRKSLTQAQMIERKADASLAPELRVHLAEVLSASREMDAFLGRLAKFATAGAASSEQPAGDICTLFDSALRRLGNKNVNAEVDANQLRACGVLAPYSIESLFGELLDNALKFRQGPVKITLLVQRLDDKHVFGVQDTGIGFDPQFSERVFRPLERLHPAGVYPGYGLGLAICREIVESYGGQLWAESEPGEGSTFWFSMPL